MDLQTVFPDIKEVTDLIEPLDGRVLLQVQYQPDYVGTIVLTTVSQEREQYSRSLSKVISCGEHAFYDKRTGNKWVDINPGDYVIAPGLSGKRITVKHPNDPKQEIHLVLTDDVHIEVKINDPLKYLSSLSN